MPNNSITPLWAAGVPDKPLDWFYPSVFVRGELNGVQGIPGDGKTWLMCEIAAQTSIGGVVQGVHGESDVAELPLGNVLYLSGDDAPERLKERLAACGADLSKVAFAPEGALPQIGGSEMERLFEQTTPTLCVIDTLQHFTSKASAGDMTAITAALQPLQVLARQYNTAVVVIMHISKNAAQGNGGDSTSYAIGSYAIAGIFRTLWTLGRLKDANGKQSVTRALCQSKNNYAEFDPPALLFELHNGFRWSGVDEDLTAEDLFNKSKRQRGRPPEKKDGVKAEILRLLESGEPMPSAELEVAVCAATSCHPNTLAAAKKELGVESYQSGRQWFARIGQNTINARSTDIPQVRESAQSQVLEAASEVRPQ
jgi:hypothetical protein